MAWSILTRCRTIIGDIPRVRHTYDRKRVPKLYVRVEGVLDFSFLDIPVLDEWNYPRHSRGVTEVPGLYAVGLPWLTKHASATLALVGEDSRYVAENIAGRNRGANLLFAVRRNAKPGHSYPFLRYGASWLIRTTLRVH